MVDEADDGCCEQADKYDRASSDGEDEQDAVFHLGVSLCHPSDNALGRTGGVISAIVRLIGRVRPADKTIAETHLLPA